MTNLVATARIPAPSARNGLLLIGLVAAVLAGAASSLAPATLLYLVVAAVMIGLLWVVPVVTLLPLALLTVAAFPTEDLPVPGPILAVPVGIAPLLVWVFRLPKSHAAPLTLRVVAAAYIVWSMASFLGSSYHGSAAVVRMIVAVSPAVALLAQPYLKAGTLLRWAQLLVVPLAVFALFEKFVLVSNPIIGGMLDAKYGGTIQIWGTYRSTNLMGHPLVGAAVFGVVFLLALGALLNTRRGLVRQLLVLALLAGGLIATVSRGPSAAAGIGALVLLFSVALRGYRTGTWEVPRRIIGFAAIGVALAAIAVPILARDSSYEGQESSANRGRTLGYMVDAVAGHEVLGVGPGQAEIYRIDAGKPGDVRYRSDLGRGIVQLENTYAQYVVSVGYPGALMYMLMLGGIVITGLRYRASTPAAAALLALAISAAGSNALTAHPQLNLLLVVLAVEVLSRRTDAIRAGSAGQ